MINENNSIYKDFDIYIVCKNKKELLKKSKQSNRSSNCALFTFPFIQIY